MTLLQKTKEIVSNSIKSVIFIDEKALENYTKKSSAFVREEELSINLNKKFKNKGISLSVHKFKQADLTNTTTLDYLFKRFKECSSPSSFPYITAPMRLTSCCLP